MKKTQYEEARFEIKLASGKSRRFSSGADMYEWTTSLKECRNWKYVPRGENDKDNAPIDE